MKKAINILIVVGLLMSLNSCIWLAVAGGTAGAYMFEKK